MKNLKMALALLAVLAMAGTSFAGITLQVTQQDDPAAGLTSWLVTGISDGGTIDTISDLTIDGMVHNVWAITKAPTTQPSAYEGQFGWVDAWAAADTHVLWGASQKIGDLGDALGETNDESNPAGYDVTTGAAMPGVAGLGTFGHPGDGGDTTMLNQDGASANLDFLQVVLPEGSDPVLLTVRLLSGGEATQFTDVEVGVIPEPSTIIMLLLGSLCLIGYRRRK